MKNFDVVIVGAGFTGLTAGYELTKQGKRVCIIEAADMPGGLAGTFAFPDGVKVEKFYHHWFNNDVYVPELVRDLGLEGEILTLPSQTGMFYNKRFWKLSTPLDLLKFEALSFLDRIRLGLLVFRVRLIKNWKSIEHLSIREWLEPLCGKTVYSVVWEPLIASKFSIFAESVNAVWMWKKLVLRGSTRNEKGGEELAYFRGGFSRLAENIVSAIEKNGGTVLLNSRVHDVKTSNGRVKSISAGGNAFTAENYLFTTSFPIVAKLFENRAPQEWLSSLNRVKYLGNICLVLRLNRQLSDTYWLNVNDPGFPFVGVIEHTNFDSPDNYSGSHIVYLSRYLAREDEVWSYNDNEYYNFAMKHLKRMFPELNDSWIIDRAVWKAEYAQPITERGYSSYVPGIETPYKNAWISTMAQIYPEDRGTNYAIREGKKIAQRILALN